MNAPAPTDSVAEVTARLEALAAELDTRGWSSRLDVPLGRLPSLYARNPEHGAAALSEHIYAQPSTDSGSEWTYWWPWAEPIAHSAADAATVIIRALRATGAR